MLTKNSRLLGLFIISLLSLGACGGGDSSSGGGVINQFENDGIYEGTQTLTTSDASGEALGDQEIIFSMSVFQDNVTISDQLFVAQAPISEGMFIASTGVFVLADETVTCDVTFIYNGTIGNSSAQGTIDGNNVCSLVSGEGRILNFPVDGTFESVRGVMSSKISFINSIQFDLTSIAEKIKSTL